MPQSTGNPTILFVDDEVNILRTLQRLFMDDAYDIVTAASGDAALALLRDGLRPAVVVSDQRMPGMDGAELLAEVRRLQPDCTRIILTGYADINAAVDAINLGEVYRYILKPWENEELKLAIRSAVERNRLVEENARLTAELAAMNEELERKVEERTQALRLSLAANLRLTEDLKEKVRELEGWDLLQKHLLSIHPREESLALLRQVIAMVVDCEAPVIWLAGEDGALVRQNGGCGGGEGGEQSPVLTEVRQEVYREQQGRVLHGDGLPRPLQDRFGSIVVLPMCRKSRCEGIVEVRCRDDGVSERTLHTLQNFLTQGAIALNDARMEAELPALEASLDSILDNLDR
ncbi:MAG: response regulator [Thermodesulfobacteriota bacterium]